MKNSCIALFLALAASHAAAAGLYSFEDGAVPAGWTVDGGTMAVSDARAKLGERSLLIDWQGGATVTFAAPDGIAEASAKKNGGINAWIYNAAPVDAPVVFAFTDGDGKEVCRLPFKLNFKGWRCLWAKFGPDMGKNKNARVAAMKMVFPEGAGRTYIDMLEFTPNVSWQNMSDAQYEVNRKDFSLIPDFNRYRAATPEDIVPVQATDEEIKVIEDRLFSWHLGKGVPRTAWTDLRRRGEEKFIKYGVRLAETSIKPQRDADGTAKGYSLFPQGAPSEIDGVKVTKFRELNDFVLLPLALNYRRTGNPKSLEKMLYVYDWFNDQGWADGSGMGTLTFEKLRSSGYFHSLYLLRDELPREVYDRELNTLRWFSLFGTAYISPEHKGEVADNLRALALPKLFYALMLRDPQERCTALTAYKRYMDNALGFAPGFHDTIKPDFTGYHHRNAYLNAYYPDALYTGALVAYLLHGTPYALDTETLDILKQALLTFRFFSANSSIPAGNVGRFPRRQQVLQELLPAFAYVAMSYDKPDAELVAAFKRIAADKKNTAAIERYLSEVNSMLVFTTSVGEAEVMAAVQALDTAPEAAPTGARFFPYAGLMVAKDSRYHFNMNGFSRYIWDFESSDRENLYGRYLCYGQIEYFDLDGDGHSFRPAEEGFDWSFIPGATTKVLPAEALKAKGGASAGHRHFSDETFLCGVAGRDGTNAMFSMRLHDITYDRSLRANKSVFIFPDYLFCLGSDIQSADPTAPMATTLYQSFSPSAEVKRTEKGTVADDGTLSFAVSRGVVRTAGEGVRSVAYIDHGKAPRGAEYAYYILKGRDGKAAEKLLDKSPVEVLRCDSTAHIVRDKSLGVTAGALFRSGVGHAGTTVRSVNIPLSYILEDKDGATTLTICEPDMRRGSAEHMGRLTDADVVDTEKPHDTTLVLDGLYSASCDAGPVKAAVDRAARTTAITVSTVRGQNYRINLSAAK